MIQLKKYTIDDEKNLISLIKNEGEDWKDYYERKKDVYIKNCEQSITYVLYEGKKAIGYIRSLLDLGFAVYVCDLLVDKDYRGHGYGKLMMEHIKKLYHDLEVYVMSDVDPYYEKQSYQKIGSIFEIK